VVVAPVQTARRRRSIQTRTAPQAGSLPTREWSGRRPADRRSRRETCKRKDPWCTPLTCANTIARLGQMQQPVMPRRTLSTTGPLVRKPWIGRAMRYGSREEVNAVFKDILDSSFGMLRPRFERLVRLTCRETCRDMTKTLAGGDDIVLVSYWALLAAAPQVATDCRDLLVSTAIVF